MMNYMYIIWIYFVEKIVKFSYSIVFCCTWMNSYITRRTLTLDVWKYRNRGYFTLTVSVNFISLNSKSNTVKPAYVVTSIKGLFVLSNHLF